MSVNDLPVRRLGAELTVPAPGLGCMGMSDFYGPSNEADCQAVLDRAAELGVTFWDTSDMYGKGANEALLSRWFARTGRRDQITLATKFGIVRGPGRVRSLCGRPEYVREACEYSLRRLGVDVIDLYYQHRVDPDVPIEETVGAMAGLVQEGKVRYLGLSEAGPETIRRAHATHPIAALQSEWSLWSRDIEAGPVPVCRELGIGIVPYSPLGRGFLTGRLDLDSLARGDDVAPIPGTRRIAYLEQNTASATVALTDADLSELDSLGAQVAGERYTAEGMRAVNL